MKKGVIIFLILMTSYCLTFAQQDAQYTLFPWASSYYNAGAIGEQNNTLCFTAIFNQQMTTWADVYSDNQGNQVKDNTSPQDLYIAIESYLRPLHGAIGLTIIKDKLGYNNNVGLKLGYAFKINIPTGKLSIGAQIGFYNMSFDATKFRAVHANDLVVNNVTTSESFMDLDFHFGILYKAERWFAGIGSTQLAASPVLRLSGDQNVLRTSRYLYIHGGYTWAIPENPSWELEPQALIKTDFTPKMTNCELMALARYNKVYWFGLSYRYNAEISVLFGARPFYNSSNNYLKGLDMGLSYGFPLNKLGYQNRSFGSVEVMVRYCFDIYKEPVFSGYGNSRILYKNQY